MNTKGTGNKKEKTNSADHGSGPGERMFEMMSECCWNREGRPDCSAMMKAMMEKMGNQSCCAPGTGPGPDRRKK